MDMCPFRYEPENARRKRAFDDVPIRDANLHGTARGAREHVAGRDR